MGLAAGGHLQGSQVRCLEGAETRVSELVEVEAGQVQTENEMHILNWGSECGVSTLGRALDPPAA